MPTGRREPGLSHDPARGTMLLHGGVDRAGHSPLSDTWEWDGDDWAAKVQERETLDDASARALIANAHASGLDRVVLLGQDRVYRPEGAPDEERTSLFVPKDFDFSVCQRLPERLVPRPSINSSRRAA